MKKSARLQASEADRAVIIEELFQRHYQPLVRSLSFIVLDREIAADAAQEAFLQLYVKWERISDYADPVAWLYRVAINKCRDHRRAVARAAKLLDRLAGAAGSSEEASWHMESDLLAALRSLPRRQRTAASLHYIAGFTLGQVAQAMKISEGTAKTHLFRARERLRQQLEVTE